jgi:hypothetical protein
MVQKFNEPVLVYELQDADGTIIDLSAGVTNAASIAALETAPAEPIAGSAAESVATIEQQRVQKVTLTLTALVLPVTAALDYAGVAFADLGDTNLMLLGCEADIVVTKGNESTGIEAAVDLDMAIGTATASATTLAGAMEDVLDKIDLDADTLDVDFDGHSQAATTMPLFLPDGAANQLFINCGLPVGITVDDTLTMSGTVTLYYIDLGNVTS